MWTKSDLVDMVHQWLLEQDGSSYWENRSAGTPKWNLFASFCWSEQALFLPDLRNLLWSLWPFKDTWVSLKWCLSSARVDVARWFPWTCSCPIYLNVLIISTERKSSLLQTLPLVSEVWNFRNQVSKTEWSNRCLPKWVLKATVVVLVVKLSIYL